MPYIYDQDESFKFKIRSALGLKACECDIEKCDRDTYTIKPIAKKKELRIGTIKSVYGNNVRIYLFQLCNLVFENCIFDCKIELQETIIDNKIIFEDCTFQQPIHFSYITFSKPLIFRNTTFENFTYFFAVTFNGRVEFSECNFKKELNLSVSKFYQNIDIHNSSLQYANIKQINFEREANFSNCKFQNEANFSKSIFHEKANFEEAIFKASTYFDKTIFEGIATFERSEFCKNAHFYQTKFNEDPNFFQATFNEYLNLTDAKIHNKDTNIDITIFNFSFDELREKAQTCSEADKYRDIFKNIKNALIKSGNLLGASRFRKMELYCKEIELDLKKKENTKSSEFRDVFKNIKNALIENDNLLDASHFHKMELYCEEIERRLNKKYKKKSRDISVKNNNIPYNNKIETYTKKYEQKREKSEKPDIRDTVDRIQLMFYRLTSDHHTDLLLILNNVLGLIVLFGAFVCGLCYFASHDIKCVDYECCTSAEVYYLHSLMTNSFCVDCNIWSIFCLEAFLIMLVCCAFVVAFILLVFFFNYVNSICRELGYWFIVFFVFVLFIIAVKPAIMLPIFGKLIDESLKVDFPAFTSLSVVYAILMFLLIWSLQKTARKNTIVPN